MWLHPFAEVADRLRIARVSGHVPPSGQRCQHTTSTPVRAGLVGSVRKEVAPLIARRGLLRDALDELGKVWVGWAAGNASYISAAASAGDEKPHRGQRRTRS